ncbi:UNVERIFIED_CONTAM: hypothetical protein GTU68_015365 [Idotea baltica]|nr:hypothetical protein [Idotea baltica]
MAFVFSLLISTIFGRRIIDKLRRLQVGETVRDLGLDGQVQKAGTPTMGGVIVILATLIPVFLFAKLDNVYIIILVVSTVWMGLIGFIDDYIKVFKKNKDGLKGKFKVLGQVGLGVFVALMLYFSPQVVIKEKLNNGAAVQTEQLQNTSPSALFAVSNGANLTDGVDGLAAGTSSIIVLALGVFAWVSGEMTIFISAFVGGLIGFLWYNTYPAQVFMGDTGSLTVGGIIAVIAISVRKELLIPILAGIFLAENLSVILQVSYFKYTKKKYGEGKRIFLMSPLHHHYQKRGYHESKIVVRFWIVGIMLAVLSILTLKIR